MTSVRSHPSRKTNKYSKGYISFFMKSSRIVTQLMSSQTTCYSSSSLSSTLVCTVPVCLPCKMISCIFHVVQSCPPMYQMSGWLNGKMAMAITGEKTTLLQPLLCIHFTHNSISHFSSLFIKRLKHLWFYIIFIQIRHWVHLTV